MQKLRVVILGTGFGRTVQAPCVQRHPGFELAAVVGRDPAKTAAIAAEFGIPDHGSDWEAVLDRVRPDLVSVATPPYQHHPMMMAALECGAHVLCEKPTALHRFQAAEMRDRATALRRVAAMNHEFRFYPARRAALAVFQAGGIGAPRRGEILGRYAIWTRPESRGMTWLSDDTKGGGILGALGSHHTDALRLFFGEPQTALASVRVGQPWRGAERATANDACTIHYAFADGATALVDLDAAAPYRWERFEIHGTEATLRWDDGGYALWRIAPGQPPEPLEIPEAYRLAPREGEPALRAPFGVLLDRLERAIRGGEPMAPNFDDAVAVQSALDAARASSAAGARVSVEIPPPAPWPVPDETLATPVAT